MPRSTPAQTPSSTNSAPPTPLMRPISSSASTRSCSNTVHARRTSTTCTPPRGRSSRGSRSAAIDLMRRSDESQAPTVRHDASVVERDRIVAEIREKVAGDAEAAGTFEAALGSAQLFLAGRERAKTNLVTIINEMRVAIARVRPSPGRAWSDRSHREGVHGHRRRTRSSPSLAGDDRADARRALGAVPGAVRPQARVRGQRAGPRPVRDDPA